MIPVPKGMYEKVLKYIEEQEKTYFGVYVSLFFNDDSQGALPTANFDEYKKFNMIVSNPPYISSDETDVMSEDALLHEPSEALFAGSEGFTLT